MQQGTREILVKVRNVKEIHGTVYVRTLTFFSDLAGSYFIQINSLQADTVNFIYQIVVVQDL